MMMFLVRVRLSKFEFWVSAVVMSIGRYSMLGWKLCTTISVLTWEMSKNHDKDNEFSFLSSNWAFASIKITQSKCTFVFPLQLLYVFFSSVQICLSDRDITLCYRHPGMSLHVASLHLQIEGVWALTKTLVIKSFL